MAFFVKDCTVSDDEGRSHDIISDNCADRATASSYYTDKGIRFIRDLYVYFICPVYFSGLTTPLQYGRS